VGLIVILGLVVSTFIWHYASKRESEKIHAGFLRRAQLQASLTRERLLIYEEMIYSLRSAFVSQRDVNRKEFRHAAQEILGRHPGVQALEWTQIIKDDERAAIEEKASRELGHPFAIKHRTSVDGFITAPRADEYPAILYIEPLAGNEAALGYDLSSSPIAGDVTVARRNKVLVVSHPLRLAQSIGSDHEAGIIFLLPVFKSPESTTVAGFVEGVFRADAMLARPRQTEGSEGLRIFYLDQDAGVTPVLLYANPAGRETLGGISSTKPLNLDEPEDFHDVIEVGNRKWSMIVAMDPAWAARQQTRQPLLMFAAGIAITVLLGLFVNSLLHRTDRIEHEVGFRTEQLQESESRLQAILDHSPALIFVKDMAGRYVLFNQELEKLCGRPSADIKGRTDHELFPTSQADSHVANDQRVLAAGRPLEFEETVEAGGKTFTWMVQKFPLLNAEGHPYALCGISSEITDRKNFELELQENRRQLSNLISQLPGAAFRCAFDENLTALFASEGMLQLTGFTADDFVSGRMHIATLTNPADRPVIRDAVASAVKERRNFESEYRITHRDGHEKWVLVRGRPIYDESGGLRFIEGLAIDVTTLKHAETEKIAFERNLLETQKLESLGVLAGGIAHDFNNLLTAILGNASLLRYTVPRTDAGQANLEQIENAARRAADLCTQMLAYAGKGKLSSGRIDLSRLVKDTTSLLQISIGKNCELILRLPDGLSSVLGDATQLRQIVMNLVINASDAIGDRADGKIIVTTFKRQADASLLRTALHQPKLAPGVYIGLEVQDNGCGMSTETIARIFEPFFTTKFSGRGLGLSAVLGIVQSHHGALFVESQLGQGSTFRMLLPAAPGTAVETVKLAIAPPSPSIHGTILVADDEEPVRTMIEKIIRRNGGSTILAENGQRALAIFREQRDKIDLILLDLTMPGMSGEEILLELQKQKATQKIVIMSGYGEEETMQRCAELGAVGFISKPFELHTVVAKLHSLLG
jgi:PAS domain S-box-containing protein